MNENKIYPILKFLLIASYALTIFSFPFYLVQLVIVHFTSALWYVFVPLLLYWFTSVIILCVLHRGTKVARNIKKGLFYTEETLLEVGDAFYLLLSYVVIYGVGNVLFALNHVNLIFSIAYLVVDLFAIACLVFLWMTYHFIEQGVSLKEETEGIV